MTYRNVSFAYIALAAGVILIFAVFFGPEWARQQGIVDQIRSIDGNIGKLSQKITEARENDGQSFSQNLAFQTPKKTEAERSLQKLVVELAERHSFQLNQYGPTQKIRQSDRETIAFEFEGVGSYREALKLLASILEIKPAIGVESIILRRFNSYEDTSSEALVYAQLVVWAYWTSTK